MNRRSFIRSTAFASIPLVLQGIPLQSFSAGMSHSTDSDRVLVLIQLFGGNDGLNTVIPLSQYDRYLLARQDLAIPEKQVLQLPGVDEWGLHPVLNGFRNLYAEGKFNIVQSVGYANPDFSHFRSTDIWMSGSGADQALFTGWAARYLENAYPGYPKGYPDSLNTDPPAIQTGMAASLIFQSVRGPMGINIADPENVFKLNDGFSDTLPAGEKGDALGFIRDVSSKTKSYGEVIQKAATRVVRQSEYPVGNKLAAQLKLVARLIAGGLKTKLYMVSMDGFDTHAEQVVKGDPQAGRHADLLKELGDAVFAFQRDLAFLGLEKRVLGMTFSEFGRRIKSNNSAGTDHGAAAPLFVFGEQVKTGFTGVAPVLPEAPTVEDNLPMQVDYRSVYATILQQWLAMPAEKSRSWLGSEFQTLPFIKNAG